MVLERSCTDTHLQTPCGRGNLKKFFRDVDGKSTDLGNPVCVYSKKRLFLSVYVDAIKMTEKEQNMTPIGNKLLELVDLGDSTSFLGYVFLGCP